MEFLKSQMVTLFVNYVKNLEKVDNILGAPYAINEV